VRRYKLQYWHLGVLAIVLVLLISWGANYLEIPIPQPFRYLHTITAPLHRSVTWVGEKAGNVRSFFSRYREFHEEVAFYENRIAQLERDLIMAQELYQENQRLRELLDFERRVNFETVGARVIGYGSDIWGHTLIVNRGRRAGIEEGQPVITGNGKLVGQVEEVYSNTSRVTMLTNPGFVVGGIVMREESRALGMVRGTPLQDELFLMDNFSWDADVRKGDVIITSGMSEYFPKGLLIGIIETLEEGDQGLTQKAGIRPYIYGTTIEEVLILSGEWGETE